MNKRDMSCVLFMNDKGDNPNRPDRRGTGVVFGRTVKLSAWEKLDKNGNPFLSISLDEVDENGAIVKTDATPEVKVEPPKKGPGRPKKLFD